MKRWVRSEKTFQLFTMECLDCGDYARAMLWNNGEMIERLVAGQEKQIAFEACNARDLETYGKLILGDLNG